MPAEVSGTITLKAEEGDAVEVGQVVCSYQYRGKPKMGQSTPSLVEAPDAEAAAPSLLQSPIKIMLLVPLHLPLKKSLLRKEWTWKVF